MSVVPLKPGIIISLLPKKPTYTTLLIISIFQLLIIGTTSEAAIQGIVYFSNIGQNLVLDAPSPNYPDVKIGSQVEIWTVNQPSANDSCSPSCIGTRNQWWFFENSDGHIRNVLHPELVLDVRGIANPIPDSDIKAVQGTPVILWPENNPATPNQLWTWDNGRFVSHLNRNLVLDVAGNPSGTAAVGAKVIVWPAWNPPTPNQLWRDVYNNTPIH